MTATLDADPDGRLAARDTRLADLEVVLDGARLAELLAGVRPDLGVSSAAISYVRYKPGTACLAACRLQTAQGGVDAYVRLERPSERAKLAKNASRADAPGALGRGALLLDPVAAALYPYPNDRRVVALPELADPERRRARLRRALPDEPELWDAELTVLRRKPERRLVARLDAGGRRALLKAHAGDFPGASRAAKLVGGVDGPRTPRRLGRSRKWRLVVSEWLPGRLLKDLLEESPAADARAAGEALARLHAIPPGKLTPAPSEERRLRASARLAGQLVPELREPAERLSRALSATVAGAGLVVCHGDFSADQVLVHDGEVALLDLDEATLGPRERDLGTFRAALALDVSTGALDGSIANAAGEAVLDGYESAGGRVDPEALDWWTAAALLHVTSEPFRHRQARWPEQMHEILMRAWAHAPGR